MFRYQYFIRKTHIPYTFMKKFECLRVPEGDTRIPELTQKYEPIGWNTFVQYRYKPTKEEEEFQIKMKFRGWEEEVEITDIDENKV
jgi:hypothetical protein